MTRFEDKELSHFYCSELPVFLTDIYAFNSTRRCLLSYFLIIDENAIPRLLCFYSRYLLDSKSPALQTACILTFIIIITKK